MSTVDSSTRFIHIQSKLYPLTLGGIRAQFTTLSFGSNPSEEAMLAAGFAVVQPMAKPEGDVVTERTPDQKQDGTYQQAWEVRAYSQEEKDAQLQIAAMHIKNQATALRERAFADGQPIDFGGEQGVLHVQLRESDRANILGLKEGAQRAIDNGVTDPIFKLRTAENINVDLTPEQMTQVAFIALEAIVQVMEQSWVIKDAAASATTKEELPELPEKFSLFVRILQ